MILLNMTNFKKSLHYIVLSKDDFDSFFKALQLF